MAARCFEITDGEGGEITMSHLEGTIEIPMEEFWEFVHQYDPVDGLESSYGVPRIIKDGQTMEIDFAASSEGSPADWANKPKAVLQWEEHEKSGVQE
jgi:hypothetical protein